MRHPMEYVGEAAVEIRNTIDEVHIYPLSLADALREGSKFIEQSFGEWVDDDGSMCALTQAFVSVRARTG